MNEWNIQSRAHACQACQKPFEDKQPYRTLLLEQKSEFLRLDCCPACWETEYRGSLAERKGVVSCWTGVYLAPPAAPPDAIQKENAETLLRKLIELGDPRHGASCYILAVMLERKRILKVKEQTKRDGRRIFVYEHPKSGDLFTITDPDLQLNQLDQVQHDVAALLEHGLTPPAEAGAGASPTSGSPAGETGATNADAAAPPPPAPAGEASSDPVAAPAPSAAPADDAAAKPPAS